MKTIRALSIFLVLLLIPFAIRLAFYYRGIYRAPAVTRPAISEINIPETPQFTEFVDSFEETNAVVVFDLAHDNNFKEAELNVLLSRLAARGARPEYLMLGDSLSEKLRGAQGFVVISPKMAYTADDMRQVKHFVNTGGNLLMVTDPTRYEIVFDEIGLPSDRKSDVAVMNMLSASFGMIFEDDFLYNMTENAGTFRDIILSQFGDNPLTKNLDQVIFFAAHSISTRGEPVISTDENTLSSLSEKRGPLAVAALTAGDRVLGISDWTFMTEPYSSMANNDQFISNIAQFLVDGQRDYTLVDFPYFFGDAVDLRYAGKEAVGGEVLSQAGLLQSTFDTVGKKLLPRNSDSVDKDVLFIGLYDGLDYVQDYLETRQISVTVEAGTDADEETAGTPEENSGSDESAEGNISPSDVLSGTVTTDTAPVEPAIKGKISVADLGEFPTDSVTLLSLGEEAGNKVMIVLAASESALAQSLEILSTGDLSQCLAGDQSALCPSAPAAQDMLEPMEDFYLPPPDSEIPMTSSLEFIEPVEPPFLP